jgi:hypothetical protein
MLYDFNPPWRPVIHVRPKSSAVRLAGPLAFSMTGLLLDGVALFGAADDPQLALLRFALVAGAPAVAALAAFTIDRDGGLT